MLESKKEENSPQKRPPCWKIKVAKVRRVFETIRTRNPKLFDGIAVALQVVWTLATTFWSSAISNNTVLTAAITLITCGALCFAQWVLLTNRREREIIEEQEKSKTQLLELKAYEEQQINDLMKKIEIEAMDAEDQSLEMINFAHTVTHKIKMNISQITMENRFAPA